MLSWEPPALQKQNGEIISYHAIIMETEILNLDNGTVISRMGMNFNRTYNISEGRTQLIEMVHPSYNYTVRIAAATVVGIGPFSDPITVVTLEDGEYNNIDIITCKMDEISYLSCLTYFIHGILCNGYSVHKRSCVKQVFD